MKANKTPVPNPDKLQILKAKVTEYKAWVRAGKPEEA